MESDSTPNVSADELAKAYRNIRDQRDELSKEYDTKDSELVKQLDIVKKRLLDLCKSIDADSIKTSSGTITRSIKTRYIPSNWEAVYKFIEQNEAIDILEKRIHQGNFRNLIEENPELMPEGMNVTREYTIVVRRAK
tara:strand:+ start:442 stop:852 length:411 start_codon:yes stop_codon:yes gene_type:complete